ncbi:ABC transporter substrate-binding protein [Reinekea blandensis]|uniref:Probable sugar-binding periplasmic protein n=1 Tax=Reinekea blandensis MED297 TaxID=314283 RepID=A4BH48_9GAMM|nr:ABC transporter substrate-binding protein [Reinekea blandensis]EAR08547.1 ABC-type sugar transport system, periplasmic component [Reinekea sp. MED297] [Reinekea blandensis MED297]
MILRKLKHFVLLGTLSLCVTHTHAATIEVLHSWTTSSDLNAIELLEKRMLEEGVTWLPTPPYSTSDFESLNTRVFHGDAPAAVEVKDLDYKQWARLGFLANLNAIAAAQEWDLKIPQAVADVARYDGKYVSVPVSIHRTNWMWVNPFILKRINQPVPRTWADFDRVAGALKAANYPVISLSRDPEKLAQLFEAVVLSIGGQTLYQDVFVHHDVSAFKQEAFKQAVRRFYTLLSLSEDNTGIDFLATESAFVFAGDWLSQTIDDSGQPFHQTYQCEPMPGAPAQFIFKSDSFVFFNLPNIFEMVNAQTLLAEQMLDERFQRALNIPRGSISVRTDASPNGYDRCARKAMAELAIASDRNTLLPSVVHGMATNASVTDRFIEQIQALANNPMSVDESAKALSRSIRLGNYLLR